GPLRRCRRPPRRNLEHSGIYPAVICRALKYPSPRRYAPIVLWTKIPAFFRRDVLEQKIDSILSIPLYWLQYSSPASGQALESYRQCLQPLRTRLLEENLEQP